MTPSNQSTYAGVFICNKSECAYRLSENDELLWAPLDKDGTYSVDLKDYNYVDFIDKCHNQTLSLRDIHMNLLAMG